MLEIIKQIKSAIILLIVLSILTGIIYPAMVTIVAQLIFPWKANGSLLQHNQKIIGSQLIGQLFSSDKYFWSRPSATVPFSYNAQNSSGSNLGPANSNFLADVKARVDRLRASDPTSKHFVPVDLVTSSASGLDPDISPLAAYYQVSRIAKARKLSESTLQKLIQQEITDRTLKFLGEPRVNVLQLNLALDNLSQQENQPR